jgi:hypothetical protein
MSSISIPVDILRVILEHLDQDDLTRICLLNKICCSYSQDVLYRNIDFPKIPVCHTLAQSTYLARRVRSFKTREEHPELAKALRNMTCLRSLTLLSLYDSSADVLDGCIFSLDTFTCRFPFSESLLKFLQNQPSLREAHFLTDSRFSKVLDLEPTCLPNLTRITAPYAWIPHILPGRPVSEVIAEDYPRDGNPVDFSFYALSTVPIKKLAISYNLFPNSEHLLASIFPSLTHLGVDLHMKSRPFQNVCVRFPLILFDNWILMVRTCIIVCSGIYRTCYKCPRCAVVAPSVHNHMFFWCYPSSREISPIYHGSVQSGSPSGTVCHF